MYKEKRNNVLELQRVARRNFARRRVTLKRIDDLWRADLVEMGAYSTVNDANRYMLTIIDKFSPTVYAVPIKKKSR